MKFIFKILLIVSLITANQYNGPDDPAGDPGATQGGRMNGNRVLLYFENNTQLSDWQDGGGSHLLFDVSIWPNDGTGFPMLDGVALLVGAKTYIQNDGINTNIDTVVVDDLIEINNPNNNLHEVYFLQTAYREEMDYDEDENIRWGLQPVFGYTNPNTFINDYPAMSNDPNSWPSAWPSTGSQTKWPGEWDGRFGRGIQYADLETYFVANDAQDQEYLPLNTRWECKDPSGNVIGNPTQNFNECSENCIFDCSPQRLFEYYPRPGKFIQEGTVGGQGGAPWGGIGIRVEARAFQWNNPLVRDALFWEYNITNISDYDLNEMAFGYWVDNAIGGDADDDELGYFDIDLDLSYSWDDLDGGFAGGTPGIMGFAFLESPGISDDGIDNDNDGLIDESRDNEAGNYLVEESRYEGDEDGDWTPATDIDGNDILTGNQTCVIINDDVGLDGVGPNDINYLAPDEGECNGRPDCVEGVGCEPNFGETDISESDMLGLTTFKLFPIDGHQESATTKWFKNDQIMWDSLMVASDPENAFDTFDQTPANLVQLFSSSIFALESGRTERISMAEIHSMDDISNISESGLEPDAPALFILKQTVQLIYETDYRFATPPNLPTLTAEARDEHVILSWDNIAESSVDRFLPDSLQNDFEGYKIYRSTDKYFRDAQIITDGYGNPMFYDPIFQCDKIDGIQGFADYATVFGAAYYLGEDTGIEHKFIDTDVENGRTYYYAVVAYDYGLPPIDQLESGIPPSENKALIQLDENEYVVRTGQNVAVVIPKSASSGFIEPSINIQSGINNGSGDISVDVYSPGLIEDNQEYILTFLNETDNENYLSANGYEIFKKDPFCLPSYECSELNSQGLCNDTNGCSWIEVEDGDDYCNEIVCEIYAEDECLSEDDCVWIDFTCQKSNFGDDYCENILNESECEDDVSCGQWNKYRLMTSDFGQITDLNENFNFVQNNTPQYSYWTFDPNKTISTDVIDGLVFSIQNIESGSFANSGWLPGSFSITDPIININDRVAKIKTSNVQIQFSDSILYTSPEILLTSSPQLNYQLLDEEDLDIGAGSYEFITDNEVWSIPVNFNFVVKTNLHSDNPDILDLLVIDINNSGEYEQYEDKILVGTSYVDNSFGFPLSFWENTHFSLQFAGDTSPGDIYVMNYESPFLSTDTLFVHTNAPDSVNVQLHDSDMDKIKVVPNPYVAANLMEEAFSNPNQSQERKIMFTHLPSMCTIKIFTVSGVLVDVINVNNGYDDGIAYWDLLSNEGLQVAAGMYIYHVQSKITRKSKIGKFAIIK